MYLTDLADVLRAAGLEVVEVDGWQTRGHGPMTDVLGATCHHTAGLNDLDTIKNGRPGLDGPLAQIWLARTGVCYVVAAGLCWHAGVSLKNEYTNSHRIGIEAEALGTGVASDWPQVQMDAYAKVGRALSDHYAFPVSEVLGHKETCSPVGRKSDPDFDMQAFRARVASVQEDALPTPRDVWAYEYHNRQALSYLANAEAYSKQAAADAAEALALVKALAKQIDAVQNAAGVYTGQAAVTVNLTKK